MEDSRPLGPLPINRDCNYIAAFLTFACCYRCSYCINSFESRPNRSGRIMPGPEWIAGLSRLKDLDQAAGTVPVTLQGGEPSLHPDFYEIINGLPPRIRIDLLTNLGFDVQEMIDRVDPQRLRRDAPYASIRVSYHPEQMDLTETLDKTHQLLEAGFSIGIWSVLHPDQEEHVRAAQERARREGIDFRLKEFLGFHRGKLHGHYRYPQACSLKETRRVECRTTELLIGPGGDIYRCHHDLYENMPPVGHLLDPAYRMRAGFLPCAAYGRCNPCDVKIKTNRLQQFGHTSVEIRFLDEPVGQAACDELPIAANRG
ncbi:MAG: radical SAM protein [Sedimentisphaerales bacterium]|nr:radical SAM protein [Sedimentisphaerales bacterium]